LRSGRHDPALRGSPWSCILEALRFVARRERLLNELQHPAIGDLLAHEIHELFVVHGPEIIFQVRVNDPLVSSFHFAPNLGQGVGRLATFPIPKAARIKYGLEDRLQTVDQRLLAYRS